MKKSGALIVITFLLLSIAVISLHSARADDLPEVNTQIAPGLDAKDFQDKTPEELANEKSNYIKGEWSKLLHNNTVLGPLVRFAELTSPVTKPLSKAIFGAEPSVSWFYVLIVALWIVCATYLYWASQLALPFSKWVNTIITFCFVIALGTIGLFKMIAQKILDLAALSNVWWVQLIIVGGVILLCFVALSFSKMFKKMKKEKEERERNERGETAVQKLEGHEEVLGTLANEVTKSAP